MIRIYKLIIIALSVILTGATVLSIFLYQDRQNLEKDYELAIEQITSSYYEEEAFITDKERALRTNWEELFISEGQDNQTDDLHYTSIAADNEKARALLPEGASPSLMGADESTIQIVYQMNHTSYQLIYYPDGEMRKIIKPILDDESPFSILLINFDNEECSTQLRKRDLAQDHTF